MYQSGLISFLAIVFFSLQTSGQCGSEQLMKGNEKEQTCMNKKTNNEYKISKNEQDWKQELSEMEYHVLREKGTERAFTGKYYKHKEDGTYLCAACGAKLFSSGDKYDSGSGWPSFVKPVKEENVGEESDKSYGMTRTEVHCSNCGGHLGHVFPDGPGPEGLRYCINSVSLKFEKKD